MKRVYPVIFLKSADGGYMAHVPDFEIDTQGNSLVDAIAMARDSIGLMGIDMEDDGKHIPEPSRFEDIAHNANEIVSLVDIDFSLYRRRYEHSTVRRNVSLPAWLNAEAEKQGLNISAILQAALKQALHISD